MADDMFAGMKKKKKKSSKKEAPNEIVQDAPIAEPEQIDQQQQEESQQQYAEETVPVEESFEDFANLKKKKKKKAKAFDPEEGLDQEQAPVVDESQTAPVDDFEDFANLKKKKKSKRPDLAEFEAQLKADGFEPSSDQHVDASTSSLNQNTDGDASTGATNGLELDAWAGSNRDLTYQELLSRVFKILRQNNPELAGEKKRYTIVPPSVHREGSKKTVFANLVDICKRMHRQPDHVIQYLFAELGTSGSIDGNQRLVIKGRFQQKQIENVLKRYIVEYVTCKTCKSADTIMTKENRLFFLQCESCGSTRTVSAIKTGFQALTGKRAATRTG